jgi:hypothetical protein
MPYSYVPILKAKEGELIALRQASTQTKANLTPLIELQPRETEALLARTIGQIRRGWTATLPFLADVDRGHLISSPASAVDNLRRLLVELSVQGFEVIPVTGLRRPILYYDMISDMMGETDNGICIRLQSSDWQDISSLEERVRDHLQNMSVQLSDVDLLLDYEAFLPSHLGTIVTSAMTTINSISDISLFRNLIMTATAFPSQACSQPYTVYRFPRSELQAWVDLTTNPSIPRRPVFGDYTIVHPVLPDIDYRHGIKVAPKVKYTTRHEWLCLRWDARDFANFRHVCDRLTGLSEFSGSGYSWGDTRIAQCATTGVQTGNPREWVSISVNHHLTLVATQCANPPAA